MATLFAGVTFPLAPPGPDKSLVALCDPVIAKMLPFYAAVIRENVGVAFVAAMAGQSATAVADVAGADVGEYLDEVALRFPLLTMHPVRSSEARLRTLEHEAVTVTYRLEYYLPAGLTADQDLRVAPILQAVLRVLTAATYAQRDALVAGSDDVLGQAGVEALRVGRGEFTTRRDVDHRQRMLSLEIEADLRSEGRIDWPAMTRVDASIDVGAEADGLLLPDFVQVRKTP